MIFEREGNLDFLWKSGCRPLLLLPERIMEFKMQYDLNRFIAAQERDYETALKEITERFKRSHWMWYIFP